MTSYQIRYDRLIMQMGDDELEKFVREWVLKKREYAEVERFTGPAIWVETSLAFFQLSAMKGRGTIINASSTEGHYLPRLDQNGPRPVFG